MDPKHIFTSELAKNSTKLAYNLSHDYELAQKRFEEVSLEKLNVRFVILTICNSLGKKIECHFKMSLLLASIQIFTTSCLIQTSS